MFRFDMALFSDKENHPDLFVESFEEREFSDKDRPYMELAIDQYDGEDFNQNDFGHIRNDISALARAQSKEEYDMIMRKLQILKSSESLPKDIKPVDAIRLIRSRYLQSPNELISFAEHLANGDMQKINDAYEQAIAEQAKANAGKFVESSVSSESSVES